MSPQPTIVDKAALESIAEKTGVAIAIVDGPLETLALNNNSICRTLNPDGKFTGKCKAYCGSATEETAEVGAMVSFTCHAGLECRAIPVNNDNKRQAAIIGRVFTKPEDYRRATERAISGDWGQYSPSEIFENVLLTNSATVVDKAAEKVADLVSSVTSVSEAPKVKTPAEVETPETQVPAPAPKKLPEAERFKKITAETAAWRSFFGSLLQTDYAEARRAILEFVARHFGFKGLVWLDRVDHSFEGTDAYGEMKDRKVRLGIASDDRRLLEAAHNEMPLELGEKQKTDGHARTMNLFPIGVGGEISSAIATLDKVDSDDVKKQIARICHLIAPQLEILRLRSEAAHREVLAAAVRRFSDSIKNIDTDDFWLQLTQNVAEMLQAERASLLVFDDRAESLAIKAIIGARHAFDPEAGAGSRVAKFVFARNEPVVISDSTRTGLPPTPKERQYKTASFMSCPVNISGRAIGVMSFTDKASGKPFDKRSLDLYQAIAPQLAVAIDRATLKEKAGEFEQLSVTDALTGLLNRRYIEERLIEEVKRSNRHGFPMSFMMLDVDHFKTYNDEFGHPAGDEALKLVGHVIRETLRGADVAARFGGEEFAILLPQTVDEEAFAIAERIRANIEEAAFEHRKVTLSIGVASCSADLCSSEHIVSAADKALYEAKRQGRNRVRAFQDMDAAKNGN